VKLDYVTIRSSLLRIGSIAIVLACAALIVIYFAGFCRDLNCAENPQAYVYIVVGLVVLMIYTGFDRSMWHYLKKAFGSRSQIGENDESSSD
jgi:hypothetical protein